jgi:transglutaminase-like putative cysteine protease
MRNVVDGKKVKNIKAAFACFVTALIGMFSVLLNLQNTDVLRVSFTLLVTVSVIAVAVFSVVPKKVFYSAGVVVLVYGLLRGATLVNALVYFANDVYDSLFNGGLVIISAEESVEKIPQLTEMLAFLCVVAAWLITLNVRCIKSLFVSMVLMFALPVIYSAALTIPSGWIWVLGLAYVVGTVSGALVSEAAVIALGAVIIFILSKDYSKPQFFYASNHKLISYIEENVKWNVGNSEQGDGSGQENANTSVVNSGELGKLESVSLSGKIAGYALTYNTGKPQYIKTFTGKDYIYGSNRWTADTSMYLSSGDSYQMYLAGSEVDGEKVIDKINGNRTSDSLLFRKYSRDITLAGTVESYSEQVYEVDTRAYSALYEIRMGSDAYYNFNVFNQTMTRDLLSAEEYDVKSRYSQVPVQTRATISEVAGGRSAETLTEKLNAISYVTSFLLANYKYTLSPGAVPRNTDFVDYFLKENKNGYCTYFATAATLMLRSYGIPARYAEGYMLTTDELDEAMTQEGTEQVVATIYGKDAHAWVEVFLDGIGWINVDATPSSGSSVPLSRLVTPTVWRYSVIEADDEDLVDEDDLDDDDEDDEDADDEDDEETAGVSGVLTADDSGAALTVRVLTTAAVVIILIGGVTAAIIILRRRADRKLKTLVKSGDVVAIYDSLTALMERNGMERPESMDYVDYAKKVEADNSMFARRRYAEIVETAVNVMYSGGRFEARADESMKRQFLGLREYLYSRMKPVKRIFVKYILAL